MHKKKTLKNFRLRITGSSSRVTGTCYHVELKIPNKKSEEYLVDCGTFQEVDTQVFNGKFLFNPRQIHTVFLTHYHVDHYGQIPVLFEQGFNGKVYSSEYTAQQLKSKAMTNFYSDRKAKGKERMLYSENAAAIMIQNSDYFEYEKEYQISNHLFVKIFPNQHVKGAVMFLFICKYKEYRIYALFTGDYKTTKFPEGLEEYRDLPISIITEGTYGIQEKPEPKFLHYIKRAMFDKKQVVVMATGEGRYENVLKEIENARASGEIPEDVLVYVNCKSKLTKKLNDSNTNPYVQFISSDEEKQKAVYEKDAKIIVVASRAGVNYFAEKMISKTNAMILLTNYISEFSREKEWLNAAKGDEITINKQKYTKHASIAEVRDFHGHAFAEDIAKFITNFSNVKAVFIGHGEKEAKQLLVPMMAKLTKIERNQFFILRRDISYVLTVNSVKYHK